MAVGSWYGDHMNADSVKTNGRHGQRHKLVRRLARRPDRWAKPRRTNAATTAPFWRHTTASPTVLGYLLITGQPTLPNPRVCRDLRPVSSFAQILAQTAGIGIVAPPRPRGFLRTRRLVGPTSLERPDPSVCYRQPSRDLPPEPPGALEARNSLSEPNRVKAENLAVRADGTKVHVEMPALSAAAITLSTARQ